MTDTTFTSLPVNGWQLFRIDDNDSEPVEARLSEPETVLGFIVTCRHGHYFSVQPVTPFAVYDESPQYALISPDKKIYLSAGPYGELIFNSIDDLKQHIRSEVAELYRELAADTRKDGNIKDSAMFSRVAKKFQKQFDENE
jgi:hypothetical protein